MPQDKNHSTHKKNTLLEGEGSFPPVPEIIASTKGLRISLIPKSLTTRRGVQGGKTTVTLRGMETGYGEKGKEGGL